MIELHPFTCVAEGLGVIAIHGEEPPAARRRITRRDGGDSYTKCDVKLFNFIPAADYLFTLPKLTIVHLSNFLRNGFCACKASI